VRVPFSFLPENFLFFQPDFPATTADAGTF
jgi:hypothetical protein